MAVSTEEVTGLLQKTAEDFIDALRRAPSAPDTPAAADDRIPIIARRQSPVEVMVSGQDGAKEATARSEVVRGALLIAMSEALDQALANARREMDELLGLAEESDQSLDNAIHAA